MDLCTGDLYYVKVKADLGLRRQRASIPPRRLLREARRQIHLYARDLFAMDLFTGHLYAAKVKAGLGLRRQ